MRWPRRGGWSRPGNGRRPIGEPRIVVERVAITPVDFAHWRFPVFWRLASDVTREIRQTVIILPEERRPGVISDAA